MPAAEQHHLHRRFLRPSRRGVTATVAATSVAPVGRGASFASRAARSASAATRPGRSTSCASAPTATTSRSAAAARSCACSPSVPAPTSVGSCCRRRRARAGGASAARPTSSPPPAQADIEVATLPGELLPVRGAEIKDYFNDLRRRVEPDLVLCHHRYRRAPGPPHGRRAGVEHVPQPPHRRVRDPQVRGRPRPAQRVRRAAPGDRRAQGRAAS